MSDEGRPSGAALPPELEARVRSWIAADPDEATRRELEALLSAADEAALRERFDHPLEFGTAGLRAPLGGGPGRMNRAVVRKTTVGLARFVRETSPEPPGEGVVVGHDARHQSALFAADAARVLAAAGVRAHAFSGALPTPITAFAVRELGAGAGVMITASHNPAADNGYKVYLADGAQVVPPYDALISAAAARSAVAGDRELSGAPAGRLVEIDERALLAAYRARIVALLDPGGARSLSVVYTPLHGVGRAVLPALFEEAGFAPPALVAAQADPDPDFPTAPFPNPEEPGVLDLGLAEAARRGADLLVANDPDADRLAVAVPATGGEEGQGGPGREGSAWRVLNGDELGVLLADHLIGRASGSGRLVATSIVSSSMLSALATARGVAYAETLTGFKWIARAAACRPGHRLVFGYEEALGYAVTDAVADKDGLSAALVVAEMAAAAKAGGRSLLDRLGELEAELGVHATAQWSLRLEGSDAPERLSALVGRWREAPPGRLGAFQVSDVRDLAGGDGDLPPANVLLLRLGAHGRVVLRPSGTEPKLKAYLEVTTPPPGTAGLAGARSEARARLAALRGAVAERFAGG